MEGAKMSFQFSFSHHFANILLWSYVDPRSRLD